VRIGASRPGSSWSDEQFQRFLPAHQYAVRGLRVRQRVPGLGVPLIGVRTPSEVRRAGERDYLGPRAKVGVTAVLRFDLTGDALGAGELVGSLELYSPLQVSEVEISGRSVPLEADLTAPIAYMLEHSTIWDVEISGLLSDLRKQIAVGLYMTEPYVPGRIPVVFVHGTASSPARWAEMFNGLLGDPVLRTRFQFWFFLYSTGNPIAYSAHLLREELRGAVRTFDPEGRDAALRRMVVVGHSQGGLLTRMQAVDSGDLFVEEIFGDDEGMLSLGLAEEQLDLLEQVVRFERMPAVERVVYLATPHRGSYVAGSWLGKLASGLISLPSDLLGMGQIAFETADEEVVRKLGGEIPTSVDNMDPEHPFLRRLQAMPLHPEVRAHSIIAVRRGGPPAEGNDGVVEYASAHLDEAESELVVRSAHSCQSEPAVIEEIRRILHTHLAE
jgi:pimeloyl-ACP methyl ester carboxylesterase